MIPEHLALYAIIRPELEKPDQCTLVNTHVYVLEETANTTEMDVCEQKTIHSWINKSRDFHGDSSSIK